MPGTQLKSTRYTPVVLTVIRPFAFGVTSEPPVTRFDPTTHVASSAGVAETDSAADFVIEA